MKYRKVTAILMSEKLPAVEKALMAMQVSGISVSQVRGYGEYHNFYQQDTMCRHARIEIYCGANEADDIAKCIINSAHSGVAGDGIVAVSPVEHFFRIRSKKEDAQSGCS